MSHSPPDRISAPPYALSLAFAVTLGAVLSGPAPAAAATFCSPAAAETTLEDPAPQQKGGKKPRDRRSPEDDEAAAESAVLLLAPSRVEAAGGEPVRLSLSVLGADPLLRLPVTVRFDPEALELTSVALGSAWDEGDRPVFLSNASRAGELVVGIAGAGAIAGTAELLKLEFRALRSGSTDVELDRFALIGAGTIQPVVGKSATIRIR